VTDIEAGGSDVIADVAGAASDLDSDVVADSDAACRRGAVVAELAAGSDSDIVDAASDAADAADGVADAACADTSTCR
jgi:hypothetical protein